MLGSFASVVASCSGLPEGSLSGYPTRLADTARSRSLLWPEDEDPHLFSPPPQRPKNSPELQTGLLRLLPTRRPGSIGQPCSETATTACGTNKGKQCVFLSLLVVHRSRRSPCLRLLVLSLVPLLLPVLAPLAPGGGTLAPCPWHPFPRLRLPLRTPLACS